MTNEELRKISMLDVLSMRKPPKFYVGQPVKYNGKSGFTVESVSAFTTKKMPSGLSLNEQVSWVMDNSIYLYDLGHNLAAVEEILDNDEDKL